MPAKLLNLKLNRVDLVDDPANPHAVFLIAKRNDDWRSAESLLKFEKAPLTSGERNDLPDSAFAAVWTDGDGHKQRALPYKHPDGTIDPSHLGNALARLNQTSMPSDVRGTARNKLEAAARSAGVGDHDKDTSMSASTAKITFVKRLLAAIVKEADAAGAPMDGSLSPGLEALGEGGGASCPDPAAHQGPPPPSAQHVQDLKDAHAALGKAIGAYGDTSKLAADHPVHAMKADHAALGQKIAGLEAAQKEAAEKEAQADAARKEAEARKEADAAFGAPAAGGAPAPQVTKMREIFEKTQTDLTKRLEAAEKRASEAEAIAKAERDARDLTVEKAELQKFRHSKIDVEKEAPRMLRLKRADKESYDAVMEAYKASDAVAKQAGVLAQELGTPLAGSQGSAWAEIEALAVKAVEKDNSITKAKAIDRVMKARPDLVKRYYAEDLGREAVAS